MTTKLDTHTFSIEPQITFGGEAELAEKAKFLGGTTKEYTGKSILLIQLEGNLTGSSCYTDRDTLMSILLDSSAKVDFYSDTIAYGSAGSPKTVWVRSFTFVHPVGEQNRVNYSITLEEET